MLGFVDKKVMRYDDANSWHYMQVAGIAVLLKTLNIKEKIITIQACRHFLRNLPGHPSPRKGQKKATSMPPAALAVLVPLDFDPPSGLKICAPQ